MKNFGREGCLIRDWEYALETARINISRDQP
jgi:hypothetical protein